MTPSQISKQLPFTTRTAIVEDATQNSDIMREECNELYKTVRRYFSGRPDIAIAALDHLSDKIKVALYKEEKRMVMR